MKGAGKTMPENTYTGNVRLYFVVMSFRTLTILASFGHLL